MAKAEWNGAVLAESDRYKTVEGNIYFPPEAVNQALLRPSNTKTQCGWKGEASYYTVQANGQINEDAAWYYPSPKPEAQHIAGYIAFWKGIHISK